MQYLPLITSTTGHIFTVTRLTLVTICLKHQETGESYIVIFTDSNKIRDYKKGFVPCLGEMKQDDIDFILNLASNLSSIEK